MSKKLRLLIAIATCLLVVALFVLLFGRVGRGERNSANLNAVEASQSPLGGMLDRMSRVSRLKEQMGELRSVWPAMSQYAQGHHGTLPTNLVELRPYLPANLARLSDERWEMPSGGQPAGPLMQRNDAILLQQKDIPANQPKIVVYSDGHIEYKK